MDVIYEDCINAMKPTIIVRKEICGYDYIPEKTIVLRKGTGF